MLPAVNEMPNDDQRRHGEEDEVEGDDAAEEHGVNGRRCISSRRP